MFQELIVIAFKSMPTRKQKQYIKTSPASYRILMQGTYLKYPLRNSWIDIVLSPLDYYKHTMTWLHLALYLPSPPMSWLVLTGENKTTSLMFNGFSALTIKATLKSYFPGPEFTKHSSNIEFHWHWYWISFDIDARN